jgi:hypothetical protein
VISVITISTFHHDIIVIVVAAGMIAMEDILNLSTGMNSRFIIHG